jgi:adenylosuccinate lyase
MRAYALAALENVALWHERDISHSSVERVIGPDATILLDFMLNRFTGMIDRLVIYPDRMRSNLNMTHGVIFSQMVLLKLIEKGMSREAAYAVVQRNAMRSWERGIAFRSLLRKDKEVMRCLLDQDLDRLFRVEHFLKNVDFIFDRVFRERQ